jgi:hypothetical protein
MALGFRRFPKAQSLREFVAVHYGYRRVAQDEVISLAIEHFQALDAVGNECAFDA